MTSDVKFPHSAVHRVARGKVVLGKEPTISTSHFINLTNGLEWADHLHDPFAYVRIESTAIEHKQWNRVLRDLDANFLMSLALGERVMLYEATPGKKASKTCTLGAKMIAEECHLLWQGWTYPAPTPEEREVKRKIGYFRRFYRGVIHLEWRCMLGILTDGDQEYFRKLVMGATSDDDS
jgi:hypothetical protein